jgi:hypothetical protein
VRSLVYDVLHAVTINADGKLEIGEEVSRFEQDGQAAEYSCRSCGAEFGTIDEVRAALAR